MIDDPNDATRSDALFWLNALVRRGASVHAEIGIRRGNEWEDEWWVLVVDGKLRHRHDSAGMFTVGDDVGIDLNDAPEDAEVTIIRDDAGELVPSELVVGSGVTAYVNGEPSATHARLVVVPLGEKIA